MERQKPGRKVKGVEEVGVFLFSRQLAKRVRGQEGHRNAGEMHQICKIKGLFVDVSLRLRQLSSVKGSSCNRAFTA